MFRHFRLLQPFPAISSQVKPFQPFPGIYGHLRPFTAISRDSIPFQTLQPFPAISSHFQSLPVISNHFQPFPSIKKNQPCYPFPAIILTLHHSKMVEIDIWTRKNNYIECVKSVSVLVNRVFLIRLCPRFPRDRQCYFVILLPSWELPALYWILHSTHRVVDMLEYLQSSIYFNVLNEWQIFYSTHRVADILEY